MNLYKSLLLILITFSKFSFAYPISDIVWQASNGKRIRVIGDSMCKHSIDDGFLKILDSFFARLSNTEVFIQKVEIEDLGSCIVPLENPGDKETTLVSLNRFAKAKKYNELLKTTFLKCDNGFLDLVELYRSFIKHKISLFNSNASQEAYLQMFNYAITIFDRIKLDKKYIKYDDFHSLNSIMIIKLQEAVVALSSIIQPVLYDQVNSILQETIEAFETLSQCLNPVTGEAFIVPYFKRHVDNVLRLGINSEKYEGDILRTILCGNNCFDNCFMEKAFKLFIDVESLEITCLTLDTIFNNGELFTSELFTNKYVVIYCGALHAKRINKFFENAGFEKGFSAQRESAPLEIDDFALNSELFLTLIGMQS